MSVMSKVEGNTKRESLLVMLVMAGILLPLRFITVYAFGDHWLGSLGVITAVTLIILTLAKKQKLGKFGDMLIRQINRFHRKGKKKWVVIGYMSFLALYGGFSVYAINEGNTTYYDLKVQATGEIAELGVKDYNDVIAKSGEMSAEEHAKAVTSLPFQKFGILAVSLAIVNDMMDNWYMFFATILVVESLEVLGIIAITSRYAKNKTTV